MKKRIVHKTAENGHIPVPVKSKRWIATSRRDGLTMGGEAASSEVLAHAPAGAHLRKVKKVDRDVPARWESPGRRSRVTCAQRACARPAGHPPSLRAFTLVEVTMALGLITFSVLALVALMPVSLQMMRGSVNDTVTAQIIQAISAEAALLDFSKLSAMQTAEPRYFDADGLPTDKKTSAVYAAEIAAPAAVTYPGAPSDSAGSLQQLPLEIRRSPGGATTTDEPRTIHLYIANNGR